MTINNAPRRRSNGALNFNTFCDDLSGRCNTWHAVTYKASNQELYSILADCYELYLYIAQSSDKVTRQFSKFLKSRNVQYKESTPLQLRIIRLVFSISNKRSYTYARVLAAARSHSIATDDLVSWLEAQGGVEEVSTKSVGHCTTAEKQRQYAESARVYFEQSGSVLAIPQLPQTLRPSSDEYKCYSLALVRCDDGAAGDIVWASSDNTLIAHALKLAGKALASEQADQQASSKVASKQSALDSAIANALPKAKRTRATKLKAAA